MAVAGVGPASQPDTPTPSWALTDSARSTARTDGWVTSFRLMGASMAQADYGGKWLDRKSGPDLCLLPNHSISGHLRCVNIKTAHVALSKRGLPVPVPLNVALTHTHPCLCVHTREHRCTCLHVHTHTRMHTPCPVKASPGFQRCTKQPPD